MTPDPEVVARLREALGHLAAGRPAAAERALADALREAPDHPQAHLLRAEAALAQGDHAAARAHAATSLGWSRERPEPFTFLARLVHAAGDSPLAARLLERALAIAPADLAAQRLLREVRRDARAEAEHPALAALARRPTVALAMIVKDEARDVARALASARPHVDELVVVDTGSTDRTAAIAAAMGARVVPFAWTDDFAAARNAALDAATADWVLVLDADERLEAPDGLLRDILDRLPLPALTGTAPLVTLRLYNHGGSIATADPWEAMPAPRLFPRAAMRYVGAAHESPELPAGSPHELRLYTAYALEIHHFGYRPEVHRARGKLARNIALLRKRMATQPEDPGLVYMLGRELVYADAFAEGLAALDRYEAMAADAPPAAYFRLAPYLRAVALRELGRPDEALAALERALALDPRYPSYHFMRGELLAEAGRDAEALASYDAALAQAGYHAQTPMTGPTAIVPAHAGELAQRRRARVAERLAGRSPARPPTEGAPGAIAAALDALDEGDLDAAAGHLERAGALAPTHAQVPYLRAEVAMRRGDYDAALDQVFASLRLGPGAPEPWVLAGWLLHVDEDDPLAARCLAHALALRPDHAAARELRRQVQAAPRARFAHPAWATWLDEAAIGP